MKIIWAIRRAVHRYLKGFWDAIQKTAAGKLHLSKTPEHLLSKADINNGTFRVEKMDANAYRKSIRLDPDRLNFHSKGFGIWDVGFEDLPQLTNSIEGLGETDLCIISHPGFCGSTLMANMLEALPAFMVYREPLVWRSITDLIYRPDHLAHKYSKQQVDEISLAVLRLFSRTWSPQQKSVVKSNPSSMGLDFHAHRLAPSTRYVYLYPALDSCLASIFKYEQRFHWIDTQLSYEWLWLCSDHMGMRENLGSLPRHLKAALHWKLHTSAMAGFSSSQPGAVMTVPSDEFFKDKAGVIRKVATHFSRHPSEDEIQNLIQSDICNYYSKNRARKYNDDDRAREENTVLLKHRSEIDEAASWLSENWGNSPAVS